MGLDLGQSHGWVVAELGRRRPVAESMASLMDRCEAAHPHPDWAKLRALPYSDLSPLLEWVQEPFREEPPVSPLRGLWFGLFNPCPDGRTPVADIYRIAYRQGARVPEQKGCLGNDAEFPLVLGYGAFAVQELLGQVEPSLLLGRSDSLGVAVGFDSGDFVLVGRLVRDGLAALA